jgi:hypothetical protein
MIYIALKDVLPLSRNDGNKMSEMPALLLPHLLHEQRA